MFIHGPITKERIAKKLCMYTIDKCFTKSDKFTKFIVLSTSRSGSNLLISLLNTHPAVRIYGEVIKVAYRKGIDDLTSYVQKKLFAPRPGFVKAVGFKIFYSHASENSVWNYLSQDKEIKIIHLKRENLLKQLISKKRSSRTGLYHYIENKHNMYNSPITIDYETCKNFFESAEETYQRMKYLFCGHECLELFYEDLTSDRVGSIKRVLDFIELSQRELKTSFKKQSAKKPEETLLNYNELKHRFSNTKWEVFFR